MSLATPSEERSAVGRDVGLQIATSPGPRGMTPSLLVGCLVLLLYAVVYCAFLKKDECISGLAVDENLLYYQAARNFNAYGFTNSGFLQDFSTSSRPEEHPYVYTHMPAGPEIFTALLFRVFGERYAFVRLVFALIFMVGLGCFLRCASEVLRGVGLTGAGFTLCFIRPGTILRLMDHPMYCAFPFLAFFPLLAMSKYYERKRRLWFALALPTLFLCSNYLAYQFSIMIAVCYILLRALRLVRMEWRHLLLLLGALGAGVLLHIMQNMVYLGPSTAIQDILFTISNRVVGEPTGDELVSWYNSLSIVHNGRHTLRPSSLLYSLATGFYFPGILAVTMLGLLLVACEFLRRSRAQASCTPPRDGDFPEQAWAFRKLLRIGLWTVATIAIPLLAFPAYSTDYNLMGIGQLPISIMAVAVFGCVLHELSIRRSISRATVPARLATIVLTVSALATVPYVAVTQYRFFQGTYRLLNDNPTREMAKLSALVGGRVVLTNTFPATLGYFTREAVLGVAEVSAFPENGPVQPLAAYSRFICHQSDVAIRPPSHYVLMRRLLPGLAFYQGALLQRLHAHVSARYRIVYEGPCFSIFDLSQPP